MKKGRCHEALICAEASHEDYLNLPRPSRGTLIHSHYCRTIQCLGDQDDHDDYPEGKGTFFPDGKRATMFSLSGPALVFMP